MSEKMPLPQAEDPHADIERIHRIGELETLLESETGERRARVVKRLRELLTHAIAQLSEEKVDVYMDQKWQTNLRADRARFEALLKRLDDED